MTASWEDGRHLGRESLEEYLGEGGPVPVKIDGAPVAGSIIEPAVGRPSLRKPLEKNRSPDAPRLRHRSAPAICVVDDGFPAITNRDLERLGLLADKNVPTTYMLALSTVPVVADAPKLIKGISREALR